MQNMRASLVFRSVVALLLFAGFYLLAFAMVLFLSWLAYVQFELERGSLGIAFFGVTTAALIAWSLLPRFEPFHPPGPLLSPEKHPELFSMIREVLSATGGEMPSEVYVVPGVNAFVTRRGGVLGLFARPVMGLGLPLLALLTVSELKAVLAHELGHFRAGDTRLGPWIYALRAAIGRTIIGLTKRGNQFIRKPFEWYGMMFLRVTRGISRHQELAADRLAARAVGARHLMSALKMVHAGSVAYRTFLRDEYDQIRHAGYRAPLAEGFGAYFRAERERGAVDELVAEEIEFPLDHILDTHPPLAQRLQALAAGTATPMPDDDRLALTLLGEEELDAEVCYAEVGEWLTELSWAEVPRRVLLPSWRKQAALFEGATVGELPMSSRALTTLGERLSEEDLGERPDLAAQLGARVLAAALSAALVADGYRVRYRVGRPIELRKDGQRLYPFRDSRALAVGALSVEEMNARLSDKVLRLPVRAAARRSRVGRRQGTP